MVRCNLATLLAERGLKITTVAKDTGISRTTLTALFSNRSQGIQFETLNTLCAYLKVTPSDLIAYLPIDIPRELLEVELDETGDNISVHFFILSSGRKIECYIRGYVEYSNMLDDTDFPRYYKFEEDNGIAIFFEDLDATNDQNSDITKSYLKLMNPSFLADFGNQIKEILVAKCFTQAEAAHFNIYWNSEFFKVS